jgi:hypothetical protein
MWVNDKVHYNYELQSKDCENMKEYFPKLSDAELKEGVFIGPKIP